MATDRKNVPAKLAPTDSPIFFLIHSFLTSHSVGRSFWLASLLNIHTSLELYSDHDPDPRSSILILDPDPRSWSFILVLHPGPSSWSSILILHTDPPSCSSILILYSDSWSSTLILDPDPWWIEKCHSVTWYSLSRMNLRDNNCQRI